MDTSACDIYFNPDGTCNFCSETIKRLRRFKTNSITIENRPSDLSKLVSEIQIKTKGYKYNCIVGVSGGVDSSWALVKAVEIGLKPLAVHMDNTWNSELAQNNIFNIVDKLNVDLETVVVDGEAYNNVLKALLAADVIDLEILYDNAMLAVNYAFAAKYRLPYILSGGNTSTEGMKIPKNWNWFKLDKRNVKSISATYDSLSDFRKLPLIGVLDFAKYRFVDHIKFIQFLDYFPYNKNDIINKLVDEYGFKPYPYKHYESTLTRFYQGYILPAKFGVDKRKVHLSSLICSGQLTRGQAITLMNTSPYPDDNLLLDDTNYFLKRLGWEPSTLTSYISRPPRLHLDFPSEYPMWTKLSEYYRQLRSVTR